MRIAILLAATLLAAPVMTAPAAAQVAAPAAAQAGDPAARAFVEKLANDAFATLRDKSLSKAESRDRFRAMLQSNVALDDIGARLIKRQRATITPAQYAAYQAALPDFVLNAYADRLYDYSDASLKTLRTTARGNMTDVATRVTRPGSQPVDAIWQVKKTPAGKYVVNNLTVQGINLSLTQEADFNAYIQKNGFDALVTFLKTANSKSASLRAKS
ncbi:MlaC/ttg2D family ABC transporter substrate-binding protein [Polymorphobacter fuscus]|uniref:ABC transporter substrate-binding protein n=1 Tax=Sandarakinorhabdus fusca TaxID=1439888 RepID=A0A7C9GMA6_9SPHN|nr:ABC transporter substrate-binding protein [Polymorphobacter fuscus]KAB7648344.1 ABC transporter substrate-binding protein [Polymorphobacter fuscus]MQT15857.1 ABC transporter substrate-binding protein [Polymorphobacter fuscus]NJC07870.1 phospholipid transport system substrate-binding protein [Polymorphobacter fuscus]